MWPCDICLEAYPTEEEKDEHRYSHGSEAVPVMWPCDTCLHSFPSETDLEEHQNTHSNEAVYEVYGIHTVQSGEVMWPCDICLDVFPAEHIKNKHRRIFHSDCYENRLSVEGTADNRNRQNKEIHFINQSPQKERKGKDRCTYSCRVCKDIFTEHADLESHMNIHYEKRPYMCHKCGQRFWRPSKLVSHMKTHTGETSCSCTICGKLFNQVQQLKVHLRSHPKEKPFICKICGKCFTFKRGLIYHMKTHGGRKCHKCPQCWRGFIDESLLKRHIMTHSKERPHACSVCGKSFGQRRYLRRHENLHHNKNRQNSHLCFICGQSFCRLQTLDKHMKTQHGDVEQNNGENCKEGQEDSHNADSQKYEMCVCQLCHCVSRTHEDHHQHLHKHLLDIDKLIAENELNRVYADHENDYNYLSVNPSKTDRHIADSVRSANIYEASTADIEHIPQHPMRFNSESSNLRQVDVSDGQAEDGGASLSGDDTYLDEDPYTQHEHKTPHTPSGANSNALYFCEKCHYLSYNLQRHEQHLKSHNSEVNDSHSGQDCYEYVPESKMYLCSICFLLIDNYLLYQQHVQTHNAVQQVDIPHPDCGNYASTCLNSNITDASPNESKLDKDVFFVDSGNQSIHNPHVGYHQSLPISSEGTTRSLTDSSQYIEGLGESFLPEIQNEYRTLPFSLTEQPMDYVRENKDIRQAWIDKHARVIEGEKPYACKVCSYAFKQVYQLKQHVKRHTAERPYLCHHCGKGFRSIHSLRFHSSIHTGNKQYPCPHCDRSFSYQCSLKYHLVGHTGKKEHECTVCSKSFFNKYQLRRHVQTHSTDKKFACSICGKRFSVECYLRDHMTIVHTDRKPHVCIQCGQSFKRKSSYDRHLKDHIEGMTHECAQCKETFTSAYLLKKHRLSHPVDETTRLQKRDASSVVHLSDTPDTKPKTQKPRGTYLCNYCDIQFDYKSQLRRHLPKHTEHNSFVCEECGKSFKHPSSLRKHRKKHTGIELGHRCNVCGKHVIDIKRHMRTHTGELPYSCQHCGQKFRWRESLKKHLKVHITPETAKLYI